MIDRSPAVSPAVDRVFDSPARPACLGKYAAQVAVDEERVVRPRPGQHQISIDLPFNCMVQGTHPRTATVTGGNTTQETFDIECLADEGSVTVVAQTNGQVNDPDGYVVNVGTTSQSVPLLGQVTFTGVPTGTHNVVLTSVEASCTIAGANPRPVTVTFNTTTTVQFVIDGTGQNGTLRVVTQTAGQDVDPDGYIVNTLGQQIVFSNNFSFDFTLVPAGNHTVELKNVAPNCSLAGVNPRTVTIQANVTTVETFDVTCLAIPVFAFESEEGGDREVVTMKADGSERTVLSNNPALDATQLTAAGSNEDPKFSPDGAKILFDSNRNGNSDVFTMNADGSGAVALTTHSAQDFDAAWSPDGLRVVFSSDRDGNDNLYVMDANGQNAVRLTSHAAHEYAASWSHDGLYIVFTSDRDGDEEIFIINADGTGERRLTGNSEKDDDPDFRPGGV